MTTPLLEWVSQLGSRELVDDSPPFRNHLAQLFQEEGLDPQALAGPSIRALRKSEAFDSLLLAAVGDRPARVVACLTDPKRSAVLDEPLVHALLRRTIVPHRAFERLFTVLRRHCLRCLGRAAPVWRVPLPLMLSLAHQCFINEYVYAETRSESDAVDLLQAHLQRQLRAAEGVEHSLGQQLLTYALYRPLWQLGVDEKLLDPRLLEAAPQLRELVDGQVRARLEDAEQGSAFPSFDPQDTSGSDEVRRLYEGSPYPRWLSLNVPEPTDIASEIKDRFPFLGDVEVAADASILIAGCGTGRHPVGVAFRHPKARITAVDFSRASLAYAARQARRYGLAHIDFQHGDLMNVAVLGRRFDIIECYGVLHHLEDPRGGLRVLAGVLAPGGFMRLGLYSRRGRAVLEPAQAFLASRRLDTAQEVRRARAQLVATLPDDEFICAPSVDFFCLSGFRDLLCHPRERRYSPAEVGALLQDCGLNFIGLDGVPKVTRDLYAVEHPVDTDMCDLASIDSFDAQDPRRLGRIVDYWARKPCVS